ncbi:unnamed protein product [Phytophthora fragariaefolia]|uniref:Unnamed protein product n=1 Tax=Phytophthora fragariaefolia TaxID=1490495 RepID=A0A9W6YA92_9STRA|nr:unnamed protein product [Phytophthora fragariaefolia]
MTQWKEAIKASSEPSTESKLISTGSDYTQMSRSTRDRVQILARVRAAHSYDDIPLETSWQNDHSRLYQSISSCHNRSLGKQHHSVAVSV